MILLNSICYKKIKETGLLIIANTHSDRDLFPQTSGVTYLERDTSFLIWRWGINSIIPLVFTISVVRYLSRVNCHCYIYLA